MVSGDFCVTMVMVSDGHGPTWPAQTIIQN